MSEQRPEVATNGSRIEIESLVSQRDHEPYVVLSWGGLRGQLTPTDARHHARRVLEAAEAADQDAFMVEFLTGKVGLEDHQALMTLVEFRSWRAKRDEEIDEEPADVQ